MRERLAASIRKTPKGPDVIMYGDIVILGMSKVGKTAIVDRFVNNYFTFNYTPSTGQHSYEVESLIQVEKDDDEENTKKKMVFKKSFKKSVMGKSKPLKTTQTMKRVLSVNKPGGGGGATSSAFQEGKAKGLKTLKFNLVDTPADMVEMEPITYEATLANAKGFLLVCSFDIKESVEYIKDRYQDILNVRNIDETPIILIANKEDLETKVWPEYEINTLSAQLKVKYCTSSVATKEGCEQMTAVMLNEINLYAEEELFQQSLPEDYVYYDKNDEKEIGVF